MNHNRLWNYDRIVLDTLLHGAVMVVTTGDNRRTTINLHKFASRRGFKITVRKISGIGLQVTKLP